MATLVCNICGGRLKTGEGNIAVCECCGVEHDLSFEQNSTRGGGSLKDGFAHSANLRLELAQDSYNASDWSLAIAHCNKAIEEEPQGFDVYVLKGRAIGQLMTLKNLRIEESISCFIQALKSLPFESEKRTAAKTIESYLEELAIRLMTLGCANVSMLTNEYFTDIFSAGIDSFSSAIKKYEASAGVVVSQQKVFGKATTIVCSAMRDVASEIVRDYDMSKTRSAFWELEEETDNCTKVLIKVADLVETHQESKSEVYQLVITMISELLERNSMDLVRNKWGAYVETPRLTDEEIASKKHMIREVKNKMACGE
ncbi:MAG: hypothetical protein HFJ75_05015 [Eggerthellaceae bacterium]|nr:hypothetical protein [Eggerthellaceae bacterium]